MVSIRRTLNRLKKPASVYSYGPKTEIVISEPKTKNSIRNIPLLDGVIQDLLAWKKVQEADCERMGAAYASSGMVVTNESGGYIEPRTFKDYFDRIVAAAELPHLTFHSIRHTFATRALEQGMDQKTLSVLLGHYSVSFTLDTYAHVLDDHKWTGMNLMQDIFNIGEMIPNTTGYPVVITPEDIGLRFTMPDFPQMDFFAMSLEAGMETVGKLVRDELLTCVYPPPSTRVESVPLESGQFIVQLRI